MEDPAGCQQLGSCVCHVLFYPLGGDTHHWARSTAGVWQRAFQGTVTDGI